jgi:hypothetical protein
MAPSSTWQTAQADKQALAYTAAIPKGQKMLQIMQADDHTAAQILGSKRSTAASLFTDSDWEEWGYRRERNSGCYKLKYFAQVLRDLGINDQCSSVGGDNVSFTDTHSKETKKEGTLYPATTAHFTSIINRKGGLLIAENNFGAEYYLRLQGRYEDTPLPRLLQWSDIAFLQWMAAGDLSTASNLKYVLRLNIGNYGTLAIIQHILDSPKMFDADFLWPGVTFGMDTEEGKALLGSTNGSGIGFLLAQHKQRLGMHKSVKQVTLFYPSWCDDTWENPAGDKFYSLLFELEDSPASPPTLVLRPAVKVSK